MHTTLIHLYKFVTWRMIMAFLVARDPFVFHYKAAGALFPEL